MKRAGRTKLGLAKPKLLTRSELMARIRSNGNKSTELRLIELFRANGIRGWRRGSTLFGKPDFVFPKKRLVIFVDGCFWHGHPVLCRLPATNRTYWIKQIEANKMRDSTVNHRLRESGWKVFRIWEHELKLLNARRLINSIVRVLATHRS
jgi:DNA mismatch endonuclease, patch repair protein